jgi:hypothetical protein
MGNLVEVARQQLINHYIVADSSDPRAIIEGWELFRNLRNANYEEFSGKKIADPQDFLFRWVVEGQIMRTNDSTWARQIFRTVNDNLDQTIRTCDEIIRARVVSFENAMLKSIANNQTTRRI